VTLGLPSWPSPLQALALVASPRLGLQHNDPNDFILNVFCKKIQLNIQTKIIIINQNIK
jgi:hypothetical protein